MRFRFADAMMQPFVIIHDYSIGALTNNYFVRLKSGCGDPQISSDERTTSF